jgi:hypothetical protein
MTPPPKSVAFVARTHWVVGAVIAASIVVLHLLTRDLRAIEFGRRAYTLTAGLAFLYLLAGTLVWFGAPFGPLLSRVCALLYLPRPSFGGLVWETMNSPEFRAHFRRRSSGERGT